MLFNPSYAEATFVQRTRTQNHWIVLTDYLCSRVSVIFLRFFLHHFAVAKLATTSIKVKMMVEKMGYGPFFIRKIGKQNQRRPILEKWSILFDKIFFLYITPRYQTSSMPPQPPFRAAVWSTSTPRTSATDPSGQNGWIRGRARTRGRTSIAFSKNTCPTVLTWSLRG